MTSRTHIPKTKGRKHATLIPKINLGMDALFSSYFSLFLHKKARLRAVFSN